VRINWRRGQYRVLRGRTNIKIESSRGRMMTGFESGETKAEKLHKHLVNNLGDRWKNRENKPTKGILYTFPFAEADEP